MDKTGPFTQNKTKQNKKTTKQKNSTGPKSKTTKKQNKTKKWAPLLAGLLV